MGAFYVNGHPVACSTAPNRVVTGSAMHRHRTIRPTCRGARLDTPVVLAIGIAALGSLCRVTAVHAADRLYLPMAFGPAPKPTATPIPSATWEWWTPTPAPTLAVRAWREFTDPRTVKGVAADPRSGDVWAATYGGVVHWSADGTRGDVFTAADGLPENMVTAVTVAQDGRVVVGTEHGYGAVRSPEGGWIGFEVDADPKLTFLSPDQRRLERIQTVAVDTAGTAWFGTFSGVAARRADGSWSYPPWLDPMVVAVPSIGAGPDGSVWMGTVGSLGPDVDGFPPQAGRVVVHRADDSWQVFDVRSDLRGGYWADIAVAPSGAVWALAENVMEDAQGNWIPLVERLPFGAQRWSSPELGDLGSALRSVLGFPHAMALDPAGRPWFLSENGLLVPTDGQVTRWSVEAEALIRGTREDELAIGPDGTAWIGTSEHVLRRAADGKIRRLEAAGLPSADVRAVVADEDGAWLATPAGLARVRRDGTLDDAAAHSGPVADADIRDLAVAPDGGLWVAHARGVAHRTADGVWTSFDRSAGLTIDAATALAVGGDGAVWCIGLRAADGSGGVSVRDADGQWHGWDVADGLPPLPPVSLVVRQDGSAWVSFAPSTHAPQVYDGDVMFRHDATGWSRVDVPEVLRVVAIERMVEDAAGALWVSGGSLARLGTDGRWTTYVQEHTWGGMGDALALDPKGQLWMGSDDGHLFVRRPDGAWRMIEGVGDGLANLRDVAYGPEGGVWIARPNGARWIDPVP